MTSHETGEAQCYEMTQKMRVMAEREGLPETGLGLFRPCGLRAFGARCQTLRVLVEPSGSHQTAVPAP